MLYMDIPTFLDYRDTLFIALESIFLRIIIYKIMMIGQLSYVKMYVILKK